MPASVSLTRPGQTRLLATAIFVALVTAFGVFVLPFFFAPSHPALSGSYTAGFNNRVASVAAALASALAFLLLWRFGCDSPPTSQPTPEVDVRAPISPSVLAGCLAASAAFTAGMGWMLTKAVVAYNDNLYFLEYMDEVVRYHLSIYKDFSFLYGPALLYFPIAIETMLRPFHVGPQGSYYVALGLMQMAGLMLLYATLEALPLAKSIKTVTLCLFTVCVLCPLLGLNYTLVRSLLPFSTLLFASRAKNPFRLAVLFALSEILQLAFSPELGMAFAAGACCYAFGQAFRHGASFLAAVAAPIVGAAAFLAVAGKVYLGSMAMFSKGCLNLVVEPLPYILFFLFAVVWLVPRMLARNMRQEAPESILMLSLFVVSIGLLPVAFGRCDPLHVFFNGAGIYLLAVVALSSYPPRIRKIWLLLFEGNLVWMQVVNFCLYMPALVYAARTDTGRWAEPPKDPVPGIAALTHVVGHGKVSVPFAVPLAVELELKRQGAYQPDRECFSIGVWDAESEAARVSRMNETEWALVPSTSQLLTETDETADAVIGGGFSYPRRRQPYVFGSLIYQNLATGWTPRSRSADWILYHNDRFGRDLSLRHEKQLFGAPNGI